MTKNIDISDKCYYYSRITQRYLTNGILNIEKYTIPISNTYILTRRSTFCCFQFGKTKVMNGQQVSERREEKYVCSKFVSLLRKRGTSKMEAEKPRHKPVRDQQLRFLEGFAASQNYYSAKNQSKIDFRSFTQQLLIGSTFQDRYGKYFSRGRVSEICRDYWKDQWIGELSGDSKRYVCKSVDVDPVPVT